MDVAKLVVGILLAAAITFLAWVWLVDPCNPCVGGRGEDLVYAQGPCLDGYIWNQKKDECI
ncbi:MAG: hypothetical protein AAB480_01760 [Patescibacteria group bacterium]